MAKIRSIKKLYKTLLSFYVFICSKRFVQPFVQLVVQQQPVVYNRLQSVQGLAELDCLTAARNFFVVDG